MTRRQASKLEIGARVRHTDGTMGRVSDKNWCAIVIRWDDEATSIARFDSSIMEEVEVCDGK